MAVMPRARRNAAVFLALRFVTSELAARARQAAELERWRRRKHADERRQRLLKLGAAAVLVTLAAVVLARVLGSGRGPELPEYEPVTDEPVEAGPEPVTVP
jgi:hypothetical protein